jgi:pyruvate dehydrogenase E2 component (dihydrolipoamide acetyltransferase)
LPAHSHDAGSYRRGDPARREDFTFADPGSTDELFGGAAPVSHRRRPWYRRDGSDDTQDAIRTEPSGGFFPAEDPMPRASWRDDALPPPWRDESADPVSPAWANEPAWANQPVSPAWAQRPVSPAWPDQPTVPIWLDAGDAPTWADQPIASVRPSEAPVSPARYDRPVPPGWAATTPVPPTYPTPAPPPYASPVSPAPFAPPVSPAHAAPLSDWPGGLGWAADPPRRDVPVSPVPFDAAPLDPAPFDLVPLDRPMDSTQDIGRTDGWYPESLRYEPMDEDARPTEELLDRGSTPISHRRPEPVRRATFRVLAAVIVAGGGIGLALNLTDGSSVQAGPAQFADDGTRSLPQNPAPPVAPAITPTPSPTPTATTGNPPVAVAPGPVLGAANNQTAARVNAPAAKATTVTPTTTAPTTAPTTDPPVPTTPPVPPTTPPPAPTPSATTPPATTVPASGTTAP